MGTPSYFRHSTWCNGVCLKERFHCLLALAADFDPPISDYLKHSPLVVWDPLFVHRAFSEDDSVNQLFSMVDTASMRAYSLDSF